MAEPTKTPEPKAADHAAEEEINKLRAQIRDLQAELSKGHRRAAQAADPEDSGDTEDDDISSKFEEANDVARDLPIRAMDEASKFVRGLTFAYLEQLRMAGDVLNTFTEEVFQRNQPSGRRTGSSESRTTRSQHEYRSGSRAAKSSEESGGRNRRRTISDLAGGLPSDMYSGFVRALDRALDIPGAAVDRFNESYRQTEEEAEPTLSRDRRRSDTSRSPISAERQEIRSEP